MNVRLVVVLLQYVNVRLVVVFPQVFWFPAFPVYVAILRASIADEVPMATPHTSAVLTSFCPSRHIVWACDDDDVTSG